MSSANTFTSMQPNMKESYSGRFGKLRKKLKKNER